MKKKHSREIFRQKCEKYAKDIEDALKGDGEKSKIKFISFNIDDNIFSKIKKEANKIGCSVENYFGAILKTHVVIYTAKDRHPGFSHYVDTIEFAIRIKHYLKNLNKNKYPNGLLVVDYDNPDKVAVALPASMKNIVEEFEKIHNKDAKTPSKN